MLAAAGCLPWFAKNLVWTGNPFYPLLGPLLGAGPRSVETVARWQAVHRPPNFSPFDFAEHLVDLAGRSRWLSALVLPLVALAAWRGRPRPLVRGLLLYAVYVFVSWWLLTHRLERFLVPALPLAAVLGGLGFSAFGPGRGRRTGARATCG